MRAPFDRKRPDDGQDFSRGGRVEVAFRNDEFGDERHSSTPANRDIWSKTVRGEMVSFAVSPAAIKRATSGI